MASKANLLLPLKIKIVIKSIYSDAVHHFIVKNPVSPGSKQKDNSKLGVINLILLLFAIMTNK